MKKAIRICFVLSCLVWTSGAALAEAPLQSENPAETAPPAATAALQEAAQPVSLDSLEVALFGQTESHCDVPPLSYCARRLCECAESCGECDFQFSCLTYECTCLC
jgi:hypothetical protein